MIGPTRDRSIISFNDLLWRNFALFNSNDQLQSVFHETFSKVHCDVLFKGIRESFHSEIFHIHCTFKFYDKLHNTAYETLSEMEEENYYNLMKKY